MAVELNIIGPQLRKLRFKAGISQPALAAKCQRLGWDIARDTIAKIEGQTRWVGDREFVMLAKALDVGLYELLPASSKKGLRDA